MRYLFLSILFFYSNSLFAGNLEELQNFLGKELKTIVRLYSTQDFGRYKYNNAVSALIPENDAKTVLYQIRKKLPQGAIAFIGTTRNLSDDQVEGVELVVILSDDKFDILRTAQSDGINYDITNEKIISKLQSWDKDYGIDIWQAETDTIQLNLNKLPENLEAFSTEVYKFCPDIVDQGSGNISDIAEYLKQQKAIYLWWD